MTRKTVRVSLRRFVEQVGDQKTAAVKLGISGTYLSEVLRGTKQPGPKILKGLGFRRVESYERV